MSVTSVSTRVAHAVLLVGHGTRDAEGTRQFFELSDRLGRLLSADQRVFPALLEFQSPSIGEAWQSLALYKPDRITVAPLLLFAAGHAKSDIPDAVRGAATEFSASASFDLKVCRPISRQAALVEAVRQRLVESLLRSSHPTSVPTAIVMVGRGSHDPCASADMRLLSEVAIFGRVRSDQSSLAEQFGIARTAVETTFYAMAEPRLPVTLAAVAATRRHGRIIVHPHLLFSGRLHDAIVEQTRQVAENFQSIEFVVSQCLGPTDLIAEAIAARIMTGS